ncbi:MAG: hypothetical protein KUA37_01930 [Desulfomicrobium sp.]|nr:hypothetical protein [Pseudomonadota bacterium]MBV1710750.1 hypothetical protein [Desulfomicrobium sp.]MBU4570358.1 hypothetical protein [Pseudomonadota bacterium]MBU4593279.1 hypothetical protein [Pseudomonadota bacterium]MBV1719832.1 hypothetical protein [Desulfomicrobium sp.]
MKYAYEDLGYDQFEKLIIFLCQKLFGISVQGFSKGPDGGRDAKFVGTAEIFPSKASPWTGTTIIQAKHTNGYNKCFSESDFYNPAGGTNTVIGKEMTRIKILRSKNQLDNYILFANRRLAGNAESDIINQISKNCNIPEPSITLCGIEALENWLKSFPDVAEKADLDPVDFPLTVGSDELAEIVQAIALNKSEIFDVLDFPPTERIKYRQKNVINNMSESYATYQRKKFLKETKQIEKFLADPENIELTYMYQSIIEEFQPKIIAKRKNYQTFDEVMNYLIDILLNRDPVLRQREHKRLTRAVLFYMYWNCDIGDNGDATAN